MWTDRLSQSTPCYFGAVSLDFMQQGALVASAREGDYRVY